MILINDAFVAGFMYNHTRTFLVSFQLQSTMDCQKAEQLIWTFRLWILFGSTIPWTARVAEHGGIFCFINSQGCVRLQLTMDWRFKFQQTDRVQPAAHVQIQHEDLLQVTNGGWDVWMNHALVPWTASAEHGGIFCYSVEFETFLCGHIEMKTHWGLQITVTWEIILPWWDSKHRNVGKIPQNWAKLYQLLKWWF